jgi:hypothetical protein
MHTSVHVWIYIYVCRTGPSEGTVKENDREKGLGTESEGGRF